MTDDLCKIPQATLSLEQSGTPINFFILFPLKKKSQKPQVKMMVNYNERWWKSFQLKTALMLVLVNKYKYVSMLFIRTYLSLSSREATGPSGGF